MMNLEDKILKQIEDMKQIELLCLKHSIHFDSIMVSRIKHLMRDLLKSVDVERCRLPKNVVEKLIGELTIVETDQGQRTVLKSCQSCGLFKEEDGHQCGGSFQNDLPCESWTWNGVIPHGEIRL